MAIVTIARQVGSGGQSIAASLAQRLGYRALHRNDLRREATRWGIGLPRSFEDFAREDQTLLADESGISLLHVTYGELEYDQAIGGREFDTAFDVGSSFLDALTAQRGEILLALQSVVYQVASSGRVVFVGAGTQILLAETPGILRVKIVASEDVRSARLSAAYGLTREDAEIAIRRADQEQRDYNRAIFGADWEDVLLWDVILNTDHLTVKTASEWLATMAAQPSLVDQPDPRAAATLRAAGAINRRLWNEPLFRAGAISAVPTGDVVALRGTAATRSTHDQALDWSAMTAPMVEIRDEMAIGEEIGSAGDR